MEIAVGQYKQVQGIIDSSIVDAYIKILVPKGLNVTFDPPTAPKIKNRLVHTSLEPRVRSQNETSVASDSHVNFNRTFRIADRGITVATTTSFYVPNTNL